MQPHMIVHVVFHLRPMARFNVVLTVLHACMYGVSIVDEAQWAQDGNQADPSDERHETGEREMITEDTNVVEEAETTAIDMAGDEGEKTGGEHQSPTHGPTDADLVAYGDDDYEVDVFVDEVSHGMAGVCNLN